MLSIISRLLWKIYFWFFTTVFTVIVVFFDFPWKPVDIIWVIALIIAVAAAFGYLYRQSIFTRNQWQIAISISFVYWAFYTLVLDRLFGGSPPLAIYDTLFDVLFVLPLYILALRYIRSESIWKQKTNKVLGMTYPNWGDKLIAWVYLIAFALVILAATLGY